MRNYFMCPLLAYHDALASVLFSMRTTEGLRLFDTVVFPGSLNALW